MKFLRHRGNPNSNNVWHAIEEKEINSFLVSGLCKETISEISFVGENCKICVIISQI